MESLRAIALFCEDIREEKGDTDSLVGILPDNIEVPRVPGAFVKLSLYVRLLVELGHEARHAELVLRSPDGMDRQLGAVEPGLVMKAVNDAREAGAPYAGIVMRVALNNYPVQQAGRFLAVLRHGEDEIVCGFFNIRVVAPVSPPAD